MVEQPTLLVQVPSGSQVHRQLRADAPASISGDDVVVEVGPTDERGHLKAPAAGEVVLSVPSPEGLRREPDVVRRVIERAGTGAEPIVVVVEAAEELRADELDALLDAARHAPRPVILRIIGDA